MESMSVSYSSGSRDLVSLFLHGPFHRYSFSLSLPSLILPHLRVCASCFMLLLLYCSSFFHHFNRLHVSI